MNEGVRKGVRRRPRPTLLLLLCALVLGVSLLGHIGTGAVWLAPTEVVAALRGAPLEPFHRQIVWDLRLPRALIAVLAGAMLGLAGAILQGVMRNPLASPALTGVSSGSVLLAVVWLSYAPNSLRLAVPLPALALLGGLLTCGLVYALSWRGGTDPTRLILAGVVLSAVFSSGSSLLLITNQEAMPSILTWIIGSLNGRVWTHWAMIWPWAALALPLGMGCAGLANALQLGDETAAALGIKVERAKATLLTVAALLIAGAVSVVGAVGFIGLVGPHLARRFVGDDARHLFPLSAVLAATLLLMADVAAQGVSITLPFAEAYCATLPVGAVTALLGAPFFLYLASRPSSHGGGA